MTGGWGGMLWASPGGRVCSGLWPWGCVQKMGLGGGGRGASLPDRGSTHRSWMQMSSIIPEQSFVDLQAVPFPTWGN